MNHTDPAARLADLQTRGLENAFALGRAATGVFERLARQHYAVMGDVVDYTLAQIRIPTQHTDPRAALEAQAAGTRRLAERARVRADEYVAIAGEMREMVGGAVGRTAGRAAASAESVADAVSKPASAGAKPAPASSARKGPAGKASASGSAGGTPVVLPDDSPKTAARKTAAAAAKKRGGRAKGAGDAPKTRATAKRAPTKTAGARARKG